MSDRSKRLSRRNFLLTLGDGGAATAAAVVATQAPSTKATRATNDKRATRALLHTGCWIRRELGYDSPLNLGAHGGRGASIREHGITPASHRLKYPMKLEGGKWKRVTWDQAYDDISKKLLEIRNDKEKGG